MDSRNQPLDWWNQVEQLHWQLIRAWIDCNPKRSAQCVDQPLAERLHACREYPDTISDDPVDSQRARAIAQLNDHLVWAFQKKVNQFQLPSDDTRELVGALTTKWLADLKGGLHLNDPMQWTAHVQVVSSRYLEELELCSSELGHGHPRICSEQYSVDLQLQVLHLTLDEMREPILDIGCGQDAKLVQWLLHHQKNALGIDLCANPRQGCLSIDWFKFPFVPEHFATITAHLSFSLHFLKHHLDINGQAEHYAKQYMNMLRSLQIGGCMVYTPGLPFIENLLPSQSYRVERFVMDSFPRDAEAAQFYKRHLSDDPLYTCHVQRIRR